MTRAELVVKIRDGLLNNLRNGDSSAGTHLIALLERYPIEGPKTEVVIAGVQDLDVPALLAALHEKLAAAPAIDVASAKYGSAS